MWTKRPTQKKTAVCLFVVKRKKIVNLNAKLSTMKMSEKLWLGTINI